MALQVRTFGKNAEQSQNFLLSQAQWGSALQPLLAQATTSSHRGRGQCYFLEPPRPPENGCSRRCRGETAFASVLSNFPPELTNPSKGAERTAGTPNAQASPPPSWGAARAGRGKSRKGEGCLPTRAQGTSRLCGPRGLWGGGWGREGAGGEKSQTGPDHC